MRHSPTVDQTLHNDQHPFSNKTSVAGQQVKFTLLNFFENLL